MSDRSHREILHAVARCLELPEKRIVVLHVEPDMVHHAGFKAVSGTAAEHLRAQAA
jgi:bisphosphoglycerate-independent phosphoglycerate mutase (AlkP superfamily)